MVQWREVERVRGTHVFYTWKNDVIVMRLLVTDLPLGQLKHSNRNAVEFTVSIGRLYIFHLFTRLKCINVFMTVSEQTVNDIEAQL